jgi:hypothetical protein
MPGGNLAMGRGAGMGSVGGDMGGSNMALTAGSSLSPDSDGVQNGLYISPMQYGMPFPLQGRKRGLDSRPTEKIVERRQRRMIKNRESAARSRARKQVSERLCCIFMPAICCKKFQVVLCSVQCFS